MMMESDLDGKTIEFSIGGQSYDISFNESDFYTLTDVSKNQIINVSFNFKDEILDNQMKYYRLLDLSRANTNDLKDISDAMIDTTTGKVIFNNISNISAIDLSYNITNMH